MRQILAILLSVIFAPCALAQEKPPSIPVVKTWEELQTLPPIDLGGGVKIRLGLEANKVPQWSGALLYCLTEGFVPPTGGSGPMPFGPVYATVTHENEKVELSLMKWLGGEKWPKGSYLYVRAMQADRVGAYHVTVTDSQKKVLARDRVECTKDPFHPWMPWLEDANTFRAPWRGIALPSIEGLEPVAFIEPGKTRKGRLPTLLPGDEKPSLTIEMKGKEIVVLAASEFTTSRPDHHFLARWWVNDKPFVPKQIDELWGFNGYGRVGADKELRLEFEFRPERLGAKPGDKIGLQLMHSERGWVWCDGSSQIHGIASRRDGENVRVSNRIEFTVPNKQER